MFFVYTGLNTRLALVNSFWLWMMTLLLFGAACAGKGLACWMAARLSGSTRDEAMGIGALMNARGMMEFILLNIGLERGVITPTTYTMLVMMAIATTLMAYPLFGVVYRRAPPAVESTRERRHGPIPLTMPGAIVEAFARLRRDDPDRRLIYLPASDAAVSATDLWPKAAAGHCVRRRARRCG